MTKIKITKTCECVYQSDKMAEPDDCTLTEGIILAGKTRRVKNWHGKAMPAMDLNTKNGVYYAIPNDSFEVV